MSKYKCIIFDCDGVLIDSEPIAIGVLVEMANYLGANMELDAAMIALKGKSFKYCTNYISQRIEKPLPIHFEQDYRINTFEAFRKNIQPIKGIKAVLENINVPFCVASSGPENKIRLNLELTGLLPFFEGHIFSCYAIQKWKPEPDVFLWAAETMGFKPEDCLVVEDSLSGVRAANTGGFDVFGYTEHDYGNALSKEATKTFNSMDKLLKML
ncbi:HAD family hydrolase [Algibacter amylolyticus]|uniref:HAD family hydrolase n=1 Tax=Algibacter amylolyticus TaxID=1608400 RepID=A0A5M7BH81_9FLAO|nr:HAD family hydrolase [Algibacter amylolyticus]KAA5828090.1 HAD family hydrolase [Algibacter amylolyticus]MBB5267338.1 HAD superfamily hydrolase (TIGR01509 family) [Algibacter amylolyticus]TSJ82335.1 HAD family hydrolase [Algibacter amylolyticus]